MLQKTGTVEKLESMGQPPLQSRTGWEKGSPPPGGDDDTPVRPAPEGLNLLNKHLSLRPTKTDLIGRGLMFGSTESLARRTETTEDHKAKRQSLESHLQTKLKERPAPEELKVKGILKKPVGSGAEDVKGLLSRKLDRRPSPQDLVDRNIMKSGNVSPLLVATEEMLKKRQLELALEKKLERRHKHNEILRQSILIKNQHDLQEQKRDDDKKQKKQGRGSLLSHITSKMGRRSNSTSGLNTTGKEPPVGSPKPQFQSKLSFHGEVLVARTYDSDDYDRSPATKRKYTPTERLGIAKELNQYKMYEMEVHDESKDHIHFIRTPTGL